MSFQHEKGRTISRITKKTAAMLFAAVMVFGCFVLFAYDAAAVSPTYYVSSQYKASRFYKELLSYKLTGDERYDVVSIAMTQYGYHEGNSDSDMGGENRDGYKNFAEYNRMYGKLDNGEGNGISYGYSWCAAFVSWCLRQARVPDELVGNFVSCSRAVKNFRSEGIFMEAASGYIPIAGDIIFFVKPEDAAAGYVASHVGIVVGTDSEYVYTIEGNTDLYKVCQKKYPLDGEKIVGYAVPEYKTVEGMVYDFPLRDDGKHPGMFSVNKNGLEVYREIYGFDSVIGTLSEGERIRVILTELGWGMIKYGDTVGWIPLEYADSRDYEIRLEGMGGEPSSLEILKPRGELIALSEYIPQREGYTFLGWAEEEDGEVRYLPDTLYAEEKDTVLYAVWKTSEYRVSFVDWDGSEILSALYTHGSEIILPEAPERAPDDDYTYEFSGWDPAVTAAASDAVYHAVYTAIPIPVTTVEETDVMTEETAETEETTETEEATEYITEEITDHMTDIPTETEPSDEETPPTTEITTENTMPALDRGCFSAVSFSVLGIVLAAIVLIGKRKD